MFSHALGSEGHRKQISLAYVGSACSVSATLGLLPLMVCVFSQSTLFRLQVALQGNCLKRALGCVHFPGLSSSGSGSWVLHKGTDSVGPAFCALPRSEQLCECTLPRWASESYHLPGPSRSVSWMRSGSAISGVCLLWGADLWLRPSWQMSTVQNPRKSWLATGSLLAVW